MQIDKALSLDSEFLRRGLSNHFLEIFFAYFKNQYGVPREASEDFFDNCLLFLHISEKLHHTHPDLRFYLTPALDWLDAYWDRFILHTRSYGEYCQLHFGKMMHHEPAEFSPDQATSQRTVEECRQFLQVLQEEFGPELLQRWFIDYRKQWDGVLANKKGSSGVPV